MARALGCAGRRARREGGDPAGPGAAGLVPCMTGAALAQGLGGPSGPEGGPEMPPRCAWERPGGSRPVWRALKGGVERCDLMGPLRATLWGSPEAACGGSRLWPAPAFAWVEETPGEGKIGAWGPRRP